MNRTASSEHRARVARETESESSAVAEPSSAIAVISMACRLPGGVDSPEAYWRLLESGGDAITEIPRDRFDVDAYFDPEPGVPGKTYTRWGGFLGDLTRFDAGFFGIAAREAVSVDPRERLLLETVWEACERSGYRPASLAGSRTGLFVGLTFPEYQFRAFADPAAIDAYSLLGTMPSAMVGRISHWLGLEGPSIAVDTFSSSSLVAAHLACQSLRTGECDLALAGGANVLLDPAGFIYFCQLGAQSRTGRSRAFSAEADGYVRAEGGGVVLLKRLSDARRDGDSILAIIRGSATNQAGRSETPTAPNVRSQQALIEDALANARVDADRVSYVECHGTGTPVGDPIEVQALAAAYGARRPQAQPLRIGSVKSNIGHAEAAAGVAGLMKVVLCLQHAQLPASLHCATPSRRIPWAELPIQVVTSLQRWEGVEGRRLAGVTSLGLSGTNAHVILEAAPAREPIVEGAAREVVAVPELPILLSARGPEALAAGAARLRAHMEADAALELADVAHTLATRRTHFEHRLVLRAHDRGALLEQLAAAAAGHLQGGEDRGGEDRGAEDRGAEASPGGPVAFLFTGQGSQRARMGQALAELRPEFRRALERCASHLDDGLERPLLEVMFAPPGSEASALLDRTGYTQRALFALEWSLAQLWASWGVVPDVVLGHSIGEIVAACVAGVMTLEDACRLVVARSGLMEALPEGGAMISVEATEAVVLPLLAGREEALSLAAVNAPRQVVVSGAEPEVLSLAADLVRQGLRTKRLNVSHAFHSPLIEPMLAAFEEVAGTIDYRPARLRVVSNVTGKVAGGELCTARYWVRQVREAVRFADGMQTLVDLGVRTCLEVGPQPILSGLGDACVGDAVRFVASLGKDASEWTAIVTSAGALHMAGQDLEWRGFFDPLGGRPVLLPGYAFQRERHWLEPVRAVEGGVAHPLLGRGFAVGGRGLFDGSWSPNRQTWLGGGRFNGWIVLSGPASLGIVLEAAHAAFGAGGVSLQDVTFEEALLFGEAEQRTVQVTIHEHEDGDTRFRLVSRSADSGDGDGEWALHATGRVARDEGEPPQPVDVTEVRGRLRAPTDGAATAQVLAAAGIQRTGRAQAVREVWSSRAECVAAVQASEGMARDVAGCRFHPVLLDGCVLAALAALDPKLADAEDGVHHPVAVERIRSFRQPGGALWVYAKDPSESDGALRIETVLVLDEAGQVVAELSGLQFRRTPLKALARMGFRRLAPLLHELVWRSSELADVAQVSPPAPSWTCVALTDGSATGEAFARLVASKGGRVVEVRRGAGFAALADGRLAVDPFAPEDLGRALETAAAIGQVRAVCHLWAAEDADAARDHRDLEQESWTHAGSVLATASALRAAAGGPALWIVTRGAQPVGRTAVSPGQSLLWGLARSLRLESPGVWGGIVDLGTEDEPDQQARHLLEAMWLKGEDQLAFRADRRCVPRLVRPRGEPWSADGGRVSPDGNYLVTGAFGGLGLVVARHLAEMGARHLVLAGRRPPDERAIAAIRALEELGVRVIVAQTDLAIDAEVRALFDQIDRTPPPLKGVLHLAGESEDGPLAGLDRDRLWRVLAPKVAGGWNLHRATAVRALDFFVLFSSQGALLGAPGQGGSSAADAFLDGLAHYRRSQGLPALSIDWAAWGEIGDGVRPGTPAARAAAEWRKQGVDPLSSRQGLATLEGLLGSRLSQVAVMQASWPRVASSLARRVAQPMLSVLAGADARGRRKERPPLVRELTGLPKLERRERLVALVRGVVAQRLGYRRTEHVPVTRPLLDMGVDSLMMGDVSTSLSKLFGERLPATLGLDYPTVEAVAGHLEQRIFGGAAATAADARPETRDEPLAIVAMACRFPGGVETPEEYWRLLADGVDAITEVPRDRWDVDRFFDPDPEAPGKTYTRWGGFLRDVSRFDAGFFGISPREAKSIDPQQRLLLEASWEVLERGGYVPSDLMGSRTGVYMGLMQNEYQAAAMADASAIDAYSFLGSTHSAMVGRISYWLGLQGPNVAVDTACSSSLVALHLACQGLRAGECDLALAGGVNTLLAPEGFVYFSRLRAMSPTGRCHTFTDDADGYVRAEGCGVVLLKRLSDAQRDGDEILAVVRGSAINQDGRSSGLTAPNGPSQETVIREALRRAELDPGTVSYVECHGTGTALGDPIEVQALAAVYGRGRKPDAPLQLGSVKTNIGHAEGAAGIASIIKVVLCLRQRQLPRTLHFTTPNRKIDWSSLPVEVVTAHRTWARRGSTPLRTGVSSFGFSGTNVHVILEEAPGRDVGAEAARSAPAADPAALPILLSAQSEESLRAQADRLRAHLADPAAAAGLDLAYTLATRRTHFPRRLALLATGREALLASLAAVAAGQTPEGAVRTEEAREGKVALLFTGQGSQLAGMGRGLHARHPVFRQALEECAALLGTGLERPLLDVMFAERGSPDGALLDRTGYTQRALFALEWSLFRLLGSWGLQPDAVLGHSIGELVAACAARVMTLEDACRLVAARGSLMEALPGGGAMVSVEATEAAILPLLAGREGEVAIAAVNSPRQVVISGTEVAVEAIVAELSGRGVRTRRLVVSHAFHSPLMEPMLEPLRAVARTIDYRPAQLVLVSNVTGRRASEEVCWEDYWVRHVRQAVRFADGVRALADAGVTTFLEIGPQPTLSGLAAACLDDVAAARFVPTLRKDLPEWEAVLGAMCELHVAGVSLDWRGFFAPLGGRRVLVPTYAFRRERHWLDRAGSAGAVAGVSTPATPLLGQRLLSPGREVHFVSPLPTYLHDHRVLGQPIAPGALYAAAALAAGRDVLGGEGWVLEDLVIAKPLPLGETDRLHLVLTPEGETATVQVASGGEGAWITHATGRTATAQAPAPARALERPEEIRGRLQATRSGPELYEDLAVAGLEYGPSFRWIAELWEGEGEALARLERPAGVELVAGALHPAELDACFQLAVALLPASGRLHLPFGVERLRFHGRGDGDGSLFCHARLEARSGETATVALWLVDEAGRPVAEVEALTLKLAPLAGLHGAAAPARRTPRYGIAWRELPSTPSTGTGAQGAWLILGDGRGVGSAIAARLTAAGGECVEVSAGAEAPEPEALLRRLAATGRAARGVVDLRALDADASDPSQERILGGALAMAQALARAGTVRAPLWLVTARAVQVAPSDRVSVWQAPLWGLGRVAQTELPDLECRLVDLDAGSDDELAALVELVTTPTAENQVALRGARRLVARLVPATEDDPAPRGSIAADGTYLVTGGLGGLGLALARSLAAQGARHLVLVARRPPADAANARIAELLAAGVEVAVRSADVSDRAQVEALLGEIAASMPPLRGVAHLAGVLDDGVLTDQTWSRVLRVLGPKARGAWHLHELTRDRALDFFLLYSSVASLLGTPGQASYAAANALLDALALDRRAEGLPGLSIGWGPFAERGMAVGQEAYFRRLGLDLLSPADDTAAIPSMLAGASAHLGVFRASWGRVNRSLAEAHGMPLLSELLPKAAAEPARSSLSALVRELAALPESEQRERLSAHVRELVGRITGADGGQVDPHRPLAESGMDSLMMVQLRNTLSASVGEKLPSTLGFDYPTIDALVGYLRTKLFAAPRTTAVAPTSRVSDDDPIAIVGMASRLPGGCATPEEFWALLDGGVDAVGPVPPERWDAEALYDPDPDVPGKCYCRSGGFLRDVDRFDPAFFGITPREAKTLDPQQRLLLETSWEALERAGIVPESLMESRTGTYVGLMYNDYQGLIAQDPTALDGHVASGNAYSMAAGRVSYTLGLQGPAMTVDTACSSSLVSLHLACEALRAGQCDLALAGGATLMLTPFIFIEFARLRGLSASGRARSFAQEADGTIWSEGCGMLVLERLSDARRKGHRVLAVVRGSAVNHDGRSQGLTAPNGPSQVRVMQAALAAAALSPADIDYVEAHGTGTKLGDPIEANSVVEVYGQGRPAERPCLLGSAKSNIGHAQAAAGVAAVIKVVLALQNGRIPRSLHSENPSTYVDWAGCGVRLVQEAAAWPPGERRRSAAVSAFGFSGTNAHVILEEAPAPREPAVARGEAEPPGVLPFVLSGHVEQALPAQAERLRAYLEDHPEVALLDVAHTLAVGRTHFAERVTLLAGGREDLLARLSAVAAGDVSPTPRPGGKLAFLFTGQGSQRARMGRELHAASQVFRRAIEECARHLDAGLERPLLEVMFAEEGTPASALLDRTRYTQRALFALEWSLGQLWASWGIRPDVVLGHSIGEIVAACMAGVMDLEDACRLVVARSGLMEALPEGGAMVSVEAPADVVLPHLAGKEGAVSVAAVNAPRQLVVSGEEREVLALQAELGAKGLRTKRLVVSHAFHSPRMEPMLEEFRKVAAAIRFRPPRTALISNLSGGRAGDEVCSAEYWVRHVREAVLFADGMQALVAEGVRTCVELGPQPILGGLGEKCVGESARFVASLGKARPEWESLVDAIGQVHAGGRAVDWQAFFAPLGGRQVLLPTYAFQRERLWIDGARPGASGPSGPEHPLLGRTIAGGGAAAYEVRWSPRQPAWLAGHRVHEFVVFPGPACLGVVLEAASALFGDGAVSLEDVVIREALLFGEDERRTVQVLLHGGEDGEADFRILSRAADAEAAEDWVLHTSGRVRRDGGAPRREVPRVAELQARLPAQLTGEEFYRVVGAGGIQYGGAFRGVGTIWHGGTETLARVTATADLEGALDDLRFHPAFLDVCLHAAFGGMLELFRGEGSDPYMPIAFDRVRFLRRPTRGMWSYSRLRGGERSLGQETYEVETMLLLDDEEEIVAEISGMRIKRAPVSALARTSYRRLGSLVVEVAWKETPTPSATPPDDWTCVLLDDHSPLGDRLARVLARSRARTVRVSRGAGFERRAGDEFTIDPSSAEDYSRLLAVVAERGPAHAICLLPSAGPAAGASSLEASIWDAAGSVPALARALAGRAVAPRIWLVTRRAQPVADVPVEPGQSLLWGLARTLRLELGQGWGGVIDVDDEGDETASALLAAMVDRTEDQLVLRGRQASVPRLRRPPRVPWSESGVGVRADGAYLVTGGLGGIGQEIARWLVSRGARHLVLVGRSEPSAAVAAQIRALEERGATVRVARGDVARDEDVSRIVELFGAELPALRGVIHAAGVLEFAEIAELDRASWWRVLAPKVGGAWNLHRATQALELDFFVLFSSQASMVGAARQGSYGAANAFLDGLAHHRRGLGLPALSLNWGTWGEVGMAAGDAGGQVDRWRQQGIELLRPAEVVLALEGLLGAGLSQVGVMRMNWPRFASFLAVKGDQPMLSELSGDRPARGRTQTRLVRDLGRLSELQRRERLVSHVRGVVASRLGFGRPEQLALERPLMEMGVDSLLMVELRDELGRAVGERLPATLGFDHPTVAAIAAYLEQRFFAAPTVAPEAPVEAAVAPLVAPASDPIAIVSMACRFPGGCDTPEALWALLARGGDAVTELPADRFDVETLYDADPDAAGKSYSRHGGFLRDLDKFDPRFFRMTPREARAVDPQHRLLLETTWEALERAGITAGELKGLRAGAFVGVMLNEYLSLASQSASSLDGYASMGGSSSFASGRLAYHFDLTGPTTTVDAACASSLVALHLACQALRAGDCDLALAGGATTLLSPLLFVEFSRLRVLSPTGRARSFSQEADGTVWSEGCGMLVLERLSEAQRRGHPVLALVRGTAFVHDGGGGQGITAPNGPAQQRVMREALRSAGVAPTEVDYVEAQATGTKLGDPIEAGSIAAVYGRDRPADRPLFVGSIRSNVGHGLAASGVAGVIKVVASLLNERLPRSLYAESPSELVDWEGDRLRLVQEDRPWRPAERPRRAGVSSFGLSGTIAHAIVEEAPRAPASAGERAAVAGAGIAAPFVLSGQSEDALRAQARRLLAHLEAHPEVALADVAWTLAAGRAHFERRVALVARDRAELLAGLAEVAAGRLPPGAFASTEPRRETHEPQGSRLADAPRALGQIERHRPDDEAPPPAQAVAPRLAFLFTGQGTQFPGMGKELHAIRPVFRAALDECAALLGVGLTRPLLEVLFADEGSPASVLLEQPAYAQRAVFAVEWALYRLWASWGITPDAVAGHSIGEVAAACAAGVFSLQDACRLVVARASLPEALPLGGTLSAEAPAERAFRPPLVEPAAPELRAVAETLRCRPPSIALVSGATGGRISEEVLDPAYWVRAAREPVRFADAMRALAGEGITSYLELGPGAELCAAGERCLEEPARFAASLRRHAPAEATLRAALCGLHVGLHDVDWRAFLGADGGRLTLLPTYAFQRERYWMDTTRRLADASPHVTSAAGGLLGQRVLSPGREVLFVADLPAYLEDHKVFGQAIAPAALHAAVILAAGREVLGTEQLTVEQLVITGPLLLRGAGRLHVLVSPDADGGRTVQLSSARREAGGDGGWTAHATARVRADTATTRPAESLAALRARFRDTSTSGEAFYRRLAAAGLECGPSFRRIAEIWIGEDEVLARLQPPAEPELEAELLHPAELNACFQAAAGLMPESEVFLPDGAERIRFLGRGRGPRWCHLRLVDGGSDETLTVALRLLDDDGGIVAEVD